MRARRPFISVERRKELRDRHAKVAPKIARLEGDAPSVASFAQERIWIDAQLYRGDPIYHEQAALHVEGPFAVDAFRCALEAVVLRHEPLRTTFHVDAEGRLQQRVGSSSDLAWTLSSVSPPSTLVEDVERAATKERAIPFDLAMGPVLRTTVVRASAEDHVVLFTIHHVASDGWSVGVFVSDLIELYRAYASGRPPSLLPLAVRYRDFAAWEREALDDATLATLIEREGRPERLVAREQRVDGER